MGLVVMAALAAGGVLGLIISTVLGGAAVLLTLRRARRGERVWCVFAAASLAATVLLVISVYCYPYAPVRGGSDYDIAARNLFLQGLGYCLAPGVAGVLAALISLAASAGRPGVSRGSSAAMSATQQADADEGASNLLRG